jgi:hypothetical protein
VRNAGLRDVTAGRIKAEIEQTAKGDRLQQVKVHFTTLEVHFTILNVFE